MRKPSLVILTLALACGPLAASLAAQASRKAVGTETATTRAVNGINLAARGRCEQALPLLARALPRLSDKKLLYAAAMARAKCGMSLRRMGDAVEALALLNREFPDDPQVLYDTTHSLSELATWAARKLITTKPSSLQAMELQAESLESHGKIKESIAMYHNILAKYPHSPGIHYRLGRMLLLHGSPTAADKVQAKEEFEAELKIVPDSAATQFMLGDLAWQAQKVPEAIDHFSAATKDDASFLEAFLGLGVALNAAGKYKQAIAPLEKYARGEPDDPAGHYQLAIAYARTGRKKEAQQQMALQRAAAEKAQKQAYRPKAGSSD